MIVAVVLGIIGTFLLVAYVRGAADRAAAGEKQQPALVATATVASGTAAEDLGAVTETESVPTKVRPEDAITSLRQVRGQVTTTELVPGEVLLASRFAEPGSVAQGVGQVKVPTGFAEITLSLEPERAVGGLIVPGDRVMVVATPGNQPNDATTAVVAHQVLVTNVQTDTSSDQPSGDETQTSAPTKRLLVTLAVDDATATAILQFAATDDVWLGAEQTPSGSATS